LADDFRKTADLLRPILTRTKPDLIYLPHPEDDHPDHQTTLPILRAAMEGSSLPATDLRAYEVWTPLGQYDHVEDITSVMPKKLEALNAHKSQLQEFDYVRAITGLNEYRGALAGRCEYAEVFQSLAL
jgi:LmbE family N-acetylglucosaminyl deacetylase